MRIIDLSTARSWVRAGFISLATLTLITHPVVKANDNNPGDRVRQGSMHGSAGTAFDFHPAFDNSGNPLFPWLHEVRGVVETSNLGNCTVHFNVAINSGATCAGGHVFCLSGTMTMTTLDGDELQTTVTGWGDPDPRDATQPANMNVLHYDVTVIGGTGKLLGAKGKGQIDGIFFFCHESCFGNAYAGVATWQYDGTLQLPRGRGK